MGLSLMMNSMAFMKMSLSVSTALNSMFFFSPTKSRAKPMMRLATMICSMLAFTKGARKLEGKMPTRVSMKLTGSLAAYSSPLVSSTGKMPLKMLAKTRPMMMATAVVQR